MWYASALVPMPARRPCTVAPRAAANSSRSSTTMPAPSPSTKPLRSASKGRDASSGSSLRSCAIVRAWHEAGEGDRRDARLGAAGDDDVDLVGLQHPPAPRRCASAPDAHAETGAWTPAAAPSSSPTWAAGPLGMSIGIVRTATLRRPSCSSRSSWPSRVVAPPMPVPMIDGEAQPVDLRRPALGGRVVAEVGVRPRLAGGDDRDLLAAVEAAGLDPLEDLGGLDGELRGDSRPAVRSVDPVLGSRREPAATGQEAVPRGRHVAAERGRRPHPGDDDPLAGGAHECEEM